jgi:hypothetical protein
LVDANSSEESLLFGALFFLIHRLVSDLSGQFTSEAWNASVDHGEYVSRDDFANIVPQLEGMLIDAQRARETAQAERRAAGGLRVGTGLPADA